MQRREFITLLGGAAVVWPHAARAQYSGRERHIGVLASGAEGDPEVLKRLAAFRQGLERLGWDGRNVMLDFRFAQGTDERAQVLAKELVALQPDVILSDTTPITTMLLRESSTIPIVFVQVSDPIGSGFIANLARPGGRITGVTLYEEGITGKWLGMLKEIAPRVTRAAVIGNPKNVFSYFLRSAEAAAPSLAIEVVPTPIDNVADIESAIEAFARAPNGGILIVPDATIVVHRDLVISLAAAHRLPAVYPWRYFVTAGGLMSYGVDVVDVFQQAATYIDRILKGEKPADLPVQAPVKYETVVNAKVAKVLGLDIPPSLLVRADEVIE